MRQYAADQIRIAWSFTGPSPGLVSAIAGLPGAVTALGGAIDITPGLALGTFIQPVQNTPTYTQKPNGIGGTLRLYNPDTSGSMTLLIDAESGVHQNLMALAMQDRAVQALVGPIVIWDGNTSALSFYNEAFIQTAPDVPKGISSSVVPWSFLYSSFTEQVFGFNSNVVGD